jgi:hypothetical protein
LEYCEETEVGPHVDGWSCREKARLMSVFEPINMYRGHHRREMILENCI